MTNPLLTTSPLPCELPPFDQITVEHCREAFTIGMREQRNDVDAIAANTEPATVENTLIALENSGRTLGRVSSYFFNVLASDATPERQELDAQISPELAQHRDAIVLNRGLFRRIATVYESLNGATRDGNYSDEIRYLARKYYTEFVLAGAQLNDDDAQQLRDLNVELAELSSEFNTKLLAAAAAHAVHVTDETELAGLSEHTVSAAAMTAEDRGVKGWVFTGVLPTVHPLLSVATSRLLRQQLMEASLTRGAAGTEHSTAALVSTIVSRRAQRAELLGFAHHAELVNATETAPSVDAVNELLENLTTAVLPVVDTEREQLAGVVSDAVDTADWQLAVATRRREEFGVDADELRPYFELSRVITDGVFYTANALYGLRFHRLDDVATYHPDVDVYEVRDESDDVIGLFLGDWYARSSKRGGAWMSSFVQQNKLRSQQSVIVVNLNVPKPAGDDPALMTLDEVTTAFHEFGHALHGLLSNVTYPKFSGTSLPRDFVEYPSQVFEMWALHPDVLPHYAVHVSTGDVLSDKVAETLRAAESAYQAYDTTEYLAAAVLDQSWHQLSAVDAAKVTPDQIASNERDFLVQKGFNPDLVPPRYRTTYFAHLFVSGYAAAYYAYIWSEVLDADTVAWFNENGGLNRDAGRQFADEILSQGGSRDPLKSFRALRGRDADTSFLLKRKGLV